MEVPCIDVLKLKCFEVETKKKILWTGEHLQYKIYQRISIIVGILI